MSKAAPAAVACALVGGLLLATMPAAAQEPAANPFGFRWQERGLREHPLVGRIWSAMDGGFAALETLKDILSRADFLLLGEVHDNADAHALQGWAIRRRTDGSKAAVVFEHIRTDQTQALKGLDAFDRRARRRATAHDLLRLLDWKSSGWPPENKVIDLFKAVFQPRLPIYPASPPREQVRAVARGDAAALPADERARIRLDTPLAPPLSDALSAELKGSHCGLLPESAIPAMAIAQRYRDAAFADAMLSAAAEHGAAVLVAGNGHVRTDRAVPWYLRQRAPDRTIVAIMMLEVESGQTDPATYVVRAPDGASAIDFIVFTPRAERSDPCASLHRHSPTPR